MIVISGTIPINPAKRDEATAAAVIMQNATMEESGCNAYRFSFAVDDPNLVCIQEEWVDQAALDAHFASPHMAVFGGQMGDFVAGAGSFTKYIVASSGPLFG